MGPSRLALGVGGHQNLGGEDAERFIEHHFRTLLLAHQQQGEQIVVYSALALGADRLFVEMALEMGVQVEIVVPCANYEAIFSQETDKERYHSLLQQAHTIHRLPHEHCSNDAFLAAGHWVIDQSDLVVLAWNGLPPLGRSGTGDMASYARLVRCPFVHLDTRQLHVKTYGDPSSRHRTARSVSPKQEFVVSYQPVYQGTTLIVNQYRVRLPDGQEMMRDVVERPESLLIVPVGQQDIVLLIEEYNFGVGGWQLTLPGGKIERREGQTLVEQAQRELRQEIGYRAGRFEKLIDLSSHPGYISHLVHILVAYDLEWDPLAMDLHEEIHVHTATLSEALTETWIDHRCDPEAALALWLYAQKKGHRSER